MKDLFVYNRDQLTGANCLLLNSILIWIQANNSELFDLDIVLRPILVVHFIQVSFLRGHNLRVREIFFSVHTGLLLKTLSIL